MDKWTLARLRARTSSGACASARSGILLAGILTGICIMATAVGGGRVLRDVPRRGLLRAFDPRWHEHALELINGPQHSENHHKSVGLYFGEVAKLDDVEKALAKCGKARRTETNEMDARRRRFESSGVRASASSAPA